MTILWINYKPSNIIKWGELKELFIFICWFHAFVLLYKHGRQCPERNWKNIFVYCESSEQHETVRKFKGKPKSVSCFIVRMEKGCAESVIEMHQLDIWSNLFSLKMLMILTHILTGISVFNSSDERIVHFFQFHYLTWEKPIEILMRKTFLPCINYKRDLSFVSQYEIQKYVPKVLRVHNAHLIYLPIQWCISFKKTTRKTICRM